MEFKDKEPTSHEGAVCPYCGDIKGDMWEILHEQDDSEIIECDCGKDFEVTMNISVDYSSRPIPCKDGKHVFDDWSNWLSSRDRDYEFKYRDCENCCETKYERRDKK